MADNKKQYEEAMKNLDRLVKKQEALNKSLDTMKETWSAVSSEVFKMDGANWFKKIPLAAEDVDRLNQTISKLEEELSVLGTAFDDALDNEQNFKDLAASSAKYFSEYEKKIQDLSEKSADYYVKKKEFEKDLLTQMRKDKKELSSMSDEDLKKLTEYIGLGGKLSTVYDELGTHSKTLLISMSDNYEELSKISFEAGKVEEALQGVNKELENGSKEVFSISTGLKNWVGVISKAGVEGLMEFDRVLNDIQKNTGIAMDANATAFADMTSRVAVFGMNAEKAGQMMADMSNELDTTNFSVLSKAAEDFAAIEGATGASSEDITTIAGQLMRMGASSSDVKDYMQDASQMAQKFGVNSKKAIADISKNISKMRNMGFVGGEESLKKMVIQAQKLNQDVSEVFNVAEKARNIEGAMEMASELQLAGGSFANINPMDLLAAARNGPEELQKILTKMGADIGKFNKETGKIEFDAVDRDRLQMVADATGQTLDNVMNGIQKSKMDADKIKPFEGLLSNMSDADKALAESSLGDMMKWDVKSGKFQIDADNDLAKKMGITSLDQINGDMIAQMIKQKQEEEKTLEEQNKRNQAFQESLTNFWNALQSVFAVFQPVLEILTSAMQWFTEAIGTLPGWSKYIIGGLMLAFTFFGTSVGSLITKGFSVFGSAVSSMISGTKALFNPGTWKNLGSSIVGGMKDAWGTVKDVFTGNFKKATPTTDGATGALDSVTKTAGESEKIKPSSGGGLKGFVENLTNMSKEATKIDLKGIGKLALSMIMLAAPIGIMAALFAGVDPMLLLAFGGVLIEQAISLAIMSKFLGSIDIGNVAKGALAMVILGAAMIPFAFAAQMLGGIDWLNVLAGVGMLALIALGVAGLGFLLVPVLLGTAALAILSVGLLAFAGTMMLFSMASNMMQGMDLSWISNLGWTLLEAAPGLLLGGIALGLAVPGLLFGSLGLMAIATAATIAAAVDWSVIANMGSSLVSASGGLIAFSFAALMFANPFAFLGMMLMVGSISALASVMIPLSSSLQLGADAMTKFATGLERLSAAADTLSDEKLAKLQKISDAMAKASAAGNVAGAMASNAEVAGGGAGGGGGTRKLEIDIKMNGRDVAYVINKDTQIVK